MSDFSIFNDPQTQAEIDGAFRADSRGLTTGEKIALELADEDEFQWMLIGAVPVGQTESDLV